MNVTSPGSFGSSIDVVHGGHPSLVDETLCVLYILPVVLFHFPTSSHYVYVNFHEIINVVQKEEQYVT